MGRKINLFANMTPTDKLIVNCTRDEQLVFKQGIILDLLKESVDWDNLVLSSGAHGVVPYIYRSLKKVNSNLVPPKVLQRLKNSYLVESSRSIIFSSELSKILQELEKREIKNIVLKGPFLAEKIYPRSDLRGYADIDILIQKNNLSQTEKVLTALGYLRISEKSRLFQQEGRAQFLFQKPNAPLIDLHWEPMNNKWYPSLSQYFKENIWKNACTIKFGHSSTLALSLEDLVIYQCVHLSIHHKFHRLVWFKDVDQVLRSGGKIHWESLVATIKRYHLVTYCYYALYLTKVLLNSPIPEYVLDELRPKFLTAKVFEFFLRRENLLHLDKDKRRTTEQIWRILRDGFWERLKAIRWRFFPSIEWYFKYYPFLPRAKAVYYYPLYPFLVILRLVRRPARQLAVSSNEEGVKIDKWN